ncbi:hypothetical protein QNI26_21745, partial [Bacillus velezensis]|uniref:hypothetical protein n=1 Tax=Bacillus velezensis TaxID=492670 RepID=UPI003356981F
RPVACLDTKKPAPGRLPNPAAPAASMSRGDFTARRCQCFPDRPVNAGVFSFRRSPAGVASEPTAADLLQLPGRPVACPDTKKSRFLSAGSVSTII